MADDREELEIEKRKNEIMGILLIALGLLSGFALFTSTAGVFGNLMANIYRQIIGRGAYLMPFLLSIWGLTLIRYKGLSFNNRLVGFLLTFLISISLIHIYYFKNTPLDSALQGKGGGVIGGILTMGFSRLFGYTGAYIFFFALLLIGILLWFDIFLYSILQQIIGVIKGKFNSDNDEVVITEDNYLIEDNEQHFKVEQEKEINREDKVEEEREEDEEIILNDSKIDDENYRLPGLNLLTNSGRKKMKFDNKNKLLEETLESFGVQARVIQVSHGPTITRYELQPATGVKVSKIVSLADDIALALAAPNVRIEAPIPGKAAVGIEVPHSNNNMVRLREILSSPEFKKSSSKLTLALGRGIDGQPIAVDLTRMPHLLVAGATGSGKSVCINSLIASIIYKSKPDQVKLILIDPKKVELSHYKGLPHLFTPVVTDPQKAANVLKLVVEEMEKRYELFSETGTRGINTYNKQVNDEQHLPYIVVIIDELSDLMMVAASEVEDNICRLAQMSRAAGIHLIIATQRPSVDVITGLIKANIPSRISFAVSSQTDSRTILDMGGAEKLLGNGDMLYAPVDKQKPVRIQGAFIDDGEISNLVDFVKNQAHPEYEVEADEIKDVELSSSGESDELYEEAVKLVVNYRASISMLQRRLHIGHTRAARLIDTMEQDNIVGPYAGSKPREVLITEEELDSYIGSEQSEDQADSDDGEGDGNEEK